MRNELKLYIDTSVWNFALESERLECRLTKKILDSYNFRGVLFISDIVNLEISKAHDIRKKLLVRLLEKCKIEILDAREDSYNLAKTYIKEGIIPASALHDAIHMQ